MSRLSVRCKIDSFDASQLLIPLPARVQLKTSQKSSPPTKKAGIARIARAFRYSIDGLSLATKTETAFFQELCIFVCFAPLGLWVGETDVEKILLLGVLVLVLIVELINTAIEAAINRIGTEFHPLSGQAKDFGSAAVFLTLCLAFFTWALILFA